MQETAFKVYWRKACHRAFSKTRKSLGLEAWGQIVLKVTLAIAVIGGLLFWGSGDAASDEIIGRSVLAAIVVILFPIIYIWNLVRQPHLMETEAQTESNDKITTLSRRISELERQGDDIQYKQDIARIFSYFIEKGNSVLCERIEPDGYKEWRKKYDHWAGQVLIFLRSYVSHPDAANFLTSNIREKVTFDYEVSDAHNLIINQLLVQLDKLRSRLEDYKPYWTRMGPHHKKMYDDIFNLPLSESPGIRPTRDIERKT